MHIYTYTTIEKIGKSIIYSVLNDQIIIIAFLVSPLPGRQGQYVAYHHIPTT